MRVSLLEKVTQFNVKLNGLLAELQKYSNEELNAKPSADSWSVTQTMQHVMLSELLSVGYCKKKLSFKPQLKKASLITKGRALIAIGYLNSPLKVKAPKGVQTVNLPKETDFNLIAEKWRNQRQELITFLDDLPKEYLNKEIYKHPLVGRLSLEGMFDFFNAHFENHRKQIYRALERK